MEDNGEARVAEEEIVSAQVKGNGKFFGRVYEYLMTVPAGRVVTYGQIARAIGAPRMARHVGFALHANPWQGVVPCHRVVNRFGGLSKAFVFGGVQIQRQMLENEGVHVRDDDTVDLQIYQWREGPAAG